MAVQERPVEVQLRLTGEENVPVKVSAQTWGFEADQDRRIAWYEAEQPRRSQAKGESFI